MKQKRLNAISVHPKLAGFDTGLTFTMAIGTAIGMLNVHTAWWDAETKAHMMAYDKKLKDFTTIYDEEVILYGGAMRIHLLMVVYTIQAMNRVCIFGHQINKEQLKGWDGMSTGNTKRFLFIQSKPTR
jgi:predicted PolB exonuclease-like 3'-5' exonuclease